VTSSEIILKDGTSFDLTIPGGNSSGIKIKISPELDIESGVESEVLLDFDVSKSFVVQGNMNTPAGIKGFLFKPVIRAMYQKISGIIEGTVFENETTPVAEAHVQIIVADTVFSSAITDATGSYALIGLPAGNYKMVCEKESYTSVLVDLVTVKVKETTFQDFLLIKE
ncbi:MAG: carboxypeptidase regulatory-like domain-containing protein, partial [Bacteroidota bacterium]|nr:carboxypeptidase regulatory-like domain-containing protein [Bacteroidota bacterium]